MHGYSCQNHLSGAVSIAMFDYRKVHHGTSMYIMLNPGWSFFEPGALVQPNQQNGNMSQMRIQHHWLSLLFFLPEKPRYSNRTLI